MVWLRRLFGAIKHGYRRLYPDADKLTHAEARERREWQDFGF